MKTLLFDNRRALVLIILLILIGGISSVLTMPQEEDPKIRSRAAVILTPLPGAPAERVENLVTTVIEAQMRELEEVDIVRSTSRTGLSSVTVAIKDDIEDTAEAFSKLRDSLSDAAALLPPDAVEPRFIDDRGYAYTLLVALVWDADSPPNPLILKRSAEELQWRLRSVPGTEYTAIHGVGGEEIVVALAPDLAQSLGLSETDIAQAIAQADAKVAAGQLFGPQSELAVEVEGELSNLDRLRAVPLREGASGAQVAVGDVAVVRRGVAQPEAETALVDGRRAVVVGTRMDSGLRVGAWAASVRDELDGFEDELSDGVELQLIFDQSVYSAERFGTLIGNLLFGVGLVVSILFFTLGWRSALLVTLAIPLTALVSLTLMNLFGVPIHQMSVTGLIVALGLLVDAAIVVCDAIGRRLRSGLSAKEAVAQSVGRLWLPLFSSTVTTVLAFLPITLLTGPAGEFVGPIADSVIIALISSYVLAITVIAALAGLFLRPGAKGRPAKADGVEIPLLGPAFAALLGASLNAPRLSIIAALVLPVLGFIGVTTLPSQFFPAADRNQFHIQLRLPPQSSMAATEEAARRADAVLERNEEIVSAHWFVGSSVPPFYYNLVLVEDGARNLAEAMVTTRSLRGLTALQIDLQEELGNTLPGVQVLVRAIVQGPPISAPVELRITGRDIDTLRLLGEEARLVFSEIPEIVGTTASLAGGEPKLWLKADEAAARRAGFSLRQVADGLSSKLQGSSAGSIVEGETDLPVIVRWEGESRGSMTELASAALPNPGAAGAPVAAVPVLSLGELALTPTPATITRYQGERVNSILGYVRADALPSTAVKAFEAAVREGRFVLPPGYGYSFGGDSEARSDAVSDLLAPLGLIVTATVAVLVLTFGSFRLGAVVLAVAGLSMGLGMLSLTVFGFPFGFQPIIALMGLMGVAINAAIIIMSELKADPRAVMGDADAVRRGVLTTARHITSTTLTTFGGFLPLILSEGDFWPAFATAIAGGVLLSTVISFFFVPQVFLILTRRRPFMPRAKAMLPLESLANA